MGNKQTTPSKLKPPPPFWNRPVILKGSTV